ncbi:GNAT family N-acetyltransferase [Carnobacterium inhibens]|uniref:RibT protein n=2 Tax=Carnobacterium inhibens TaxID=147709 RepID=U5SCK1_9LACT|nr:GNAT family N-acetyltransferase [Carnobacterium inhibens]AGY81572.1 RibT protein [Carnobacterium inhibens subsp. gilichinskyi]MBC9824722.1 GNAT family N-acetyltransferase [Carnobacterium inhibens]
MLLDYKNDYEKISMGLLSFVPDLKDVSRLQNEMDWYQSKENYKLYLWKSEETQDIIAVIGVEIGNDMTLVRHISINPSFRNEGISYKILEALEKRLPQRKVMGTLETASLIAKWEQEKSKKEQQSILLTDEKGED